jgi:hypothetical protein
MKRILLVAMVAFAMSVSVSNAQTTGQQYSPQNYSPQKPIARAIDSINVAGVSFNALLISVSGMTDSVVSVTAQIRYVGTAIPKGYGYLSFADTLAITPSVGISTNLIASRVAAKHGLTLNVK